MHYVDDFKDTYIGIGQVLAIKNRKSKYLTIVKITDGIPTKINLNSIPSPCNTICSVQHGHIFDSNGKITNDLTKAVKFVQNETSAIIGLESIILL